MAPESELLTGVTAAPVEAELGSEKVLLYPLRIMDWGRIEQWMRQKIIEAATSAIYAIELPADKRQSIMVAAQDNAKKVSLTECILGGGETDRYGFLESLEGMLRIVQLSIRDKAGPEGRVLFPLDILDSKIGTDLMCLTRLFQLAFAISFPAPKPDVDKTEGAPTPNP